jgi:hypothetical protein
LLNWLAKVQLARLVEVATLLCIVATVKGTALKRQANDKYTVLRGHQSITARKTNTEWNPKLFATSQPPPQQTHKEKSALVF